MFVNVISMVTETCLCNSYNWLLGCATFLESHHAHLLFIIGYYIVVILVELNSQKWIVISLFELVVKCIKTHIFVPSISIYHIFISIIKFFCCFLLLGQIFTWNLQSYTTNIQHHLYTIFEKKESFSYFYFSHMRLQHVTLTTRKGVFILCMSDQEDVCIGIGSRDKVEKHPRCLCCQPCRY